MQLQSTLKRWVDEIKGEDIGCQVGPMMGDQRVEILFIFFLAYLSRVKDCTYWLAGFCYISRVFSQYIYFYIFTYIWLGWPLTSTSTEILTLLLLYASSFSLVEIKLLSLLFISQFWTSFAFRVGEWCLIWLIFSLPTHTTQPTYAIKKLHCCQGRKWRWLAKLWLQVRTFTIFW